jgi:hypothetical protein
MAFTCGFFNSENGDRKYNAEQMSAIFDGIIADGVFTTIGDHMAVSAGTGMQVLVGTGKAWFDHTWNVNDAAYPLAIAASDVTLSRIDAIVLETNHSDSVRLNKLRVVQGTVASSPVKPTLTNSEKVHQHPLAWVTVAPGMTQIAASAIENAVGTSACPFVTGIIATTAIDDLFNQWNGEFDEWFDNLKAQLSDNVVANLQRQIDVNKTQIQTNWNNTLKSYTKQLLSLPDSAIPDDAFMALVVGTDSRAYRVTVKYPNNTPAIGFTISGLSAIPNASLVTNKDGIAMGKSSNTTVSITVEKKYDDILAKTVLVTSTGTITDVTIILEYDRANKTVRSSGKLPTNVSALCTGIEYVLVAGGGSGGYSLRSAGVYSVPFAGGSGGGGGNAVKDTLQFAPNADIDIIIGAGGPEPPRDPHSIIDERKPTQGSSGGNSQLLLGTTVLKSVTGGGGGSYVESPSSKEIVVDGYAHKGYIKTYEPTAGGQGNGNGGSGAKVVQCISTTDNTTSYLYNVKDINTGETYTSSYTNGTPGSDGQIFELNGESIPTGGGGGGGAGCYMFNNQEAWDARKIYFSPGNGRGSAIGAGGAGGATMLTGTQGSNNVSGIDNTIIGGLAGGLVYYYKH